MKRLAVDSPTESQDVIGDLFISEGKRLTSLALRITRSVSDAEDAVQSAFLRALEHGEQLLSATNRAAWLHTTVRRLATDHVRATNRRPWSELTLNAVSAFEDEPTQRWQEVSPELLRRTLNEFEVDSAVRETFQLWWFHRLPYKQIADRLQIQASTVGTRVHRAKEHLRLALLKSLL